MKERPILFNAPMVRALLDGTKTQTRRIMKTQPGDDAQVMVERFHQTVIDRRGDEQPGTEVYGAWWSDGEHGVSCPYGQPGDRLWVREAWRYRYSSSTAEDGQYIHGFRLRCDDEDRVAGPMPMDGVGLPRQRKVRPDESWQEREDYLCAYWRRWRPSIHMPRWASRITLEITGVRVERLQDISEADAIAEGCTPNHNGYYWGGPHQVSGRKQMAIAVRAYRDLWESINGHGSWDANPWVWVVKFRRVEGGAA